METEEGPGDEIKALIEKNKHLQSQLSQYEEDFKHEREDRIRATEARDRIEKEFKDYKEANEVQLTQLNNRVEEMALKLLHAEELPRKKKGKSKKELQTALGENERLRRERNGLSTRIADLESQVDSYKKRLHATRKEYDSALKSWKSLENNTSTTEEVMKEATQKLHIRLNEAVMELEAAKEEIAVKVAQVKQYQKQVEAYKQQLEKWQVAVNTAPGHTPQALQPSEVGQSCYNGVCPGHTDPLLGGQPMKANDSDNGVKQLSSAPQPATSNTSCCEPDGASNEDDDSDDDLPPPIYHVPIEYQQHLVASNASNTVAPTNGNFLMPTVDQMHNINIAHAADSCTHRGTDSREFEETNSWTPLDQNLKCPVCGKVFKKGRIQKFRHHVLMCAK